MRWGVVIAAAAAFAATGASSPASPRQMPGQIVFSAEPAPAQIYSIAADGTEFRQVTSALWGVGRLAWSPSESLIAFVNRAKPTADGLAVGPSDGRSYRIISEAPQIWGPEWSADGRWIVYHSSSGTTDDVWLEHPDGSDPRRIASGKSLELDWSPDGGALVLTDGQELSIYDVSSGTERVIASYPRAGIKEPDWSPDGRSIAFVRIGDGTLLVYDLATHAAHAVAEYPPSEMFFEQGLGQLTWSPDSRQLAFTEDGFYVDRVRVVDIDGSGDRVVHDVGNCFFLEWSPAGSDLAVVWQSAGPWERVNLAIVRPGQTVPLDLSGIVYRSRNEPGFVWSPDGHRIAYGTEEGSLFTISADGQRQVLLAPPGPGSVVPLHWSSDGTRVFVRRDDPRLRPQSQLYSEDPRTQLVRVLTDDAGDSVQPTWSANGRRLAYVRISGLAPEVVVADASGRNSVAVGRGIEPALSPDGSRVAFVRGRRILARAVGSARTRLVARGGMWPAWSPNRRLLAYLSGGAIWLARPNGTHRHRILARPGPTSSWGPPSWSSDSETLYVRRGNGPSGVIVRNDGSVRRLLDFPDQPRDVLASDPSSDGTQIAFEWTFVDEHGLQHDRISVVSISGGVPDLILEKLPTVPRTSLAPRVAWQP